MRRFLALLGIWLFLSTSGVVMARTPHYRSHSLHFCTSGPGHRCFTWHWRTKFVGQKTRHKATQPTSFRELDEVTYYTDTGLMADGRYTYNGAAACGYELPFFARVDVPGVGLLTCEDRIGFNPWHHIDVWGYHPGLGNDYRTITVYLP